MDKTGFGNQTQQPKMQPQVQTVSVKKISWSKVIITIFVIIVVTAVIAGAYWFLVLNKSSDTSDLTGPVPKPQVNTATPSVTSSTQKDETTGWNVYKDNKITLRYPKDWERYDSLGKPSFSEKDPGSVYPGVIVPTVAIDSTPDLSLSVYGVDITGLLN